MAATGSTGTATGTPAAITIIEHIPSIAGGPIFTALIAISTTVIAVIPTLSHCLRTIDYITMVVRANTATRADFTGIARLMAAAAIRSD